MVLFLCNGTIFPLPQILSLPGQKTIYIVYYKNKWIYAPICGNIEKSLYKSFLLN